MTEPDTLDTKCKNKIEWFTVWHSHADQRWKAVAQFHTETGPQPFIKCNLVERGYNTGCISHSFFHSPFIVSCHGVKDNHRCTHSHLQSPLNQLTQCHIHLRLMTPGGRHTGIFSHGPRAHVFFWSCLYFLSVYWAGSPSRWTGSLRDYQHTIC